MFNHLTWLHSKNRRVRFGIPKFQWDTAPFLKLLDGCVNKRESLASKRTIRLVSPVPRAYTVHVFQSGVSRWTAYYVTHWLQECRWCLFLQKDKQGATEDILWKFHSACQNQYQTSWVGGWNSVDTIKLYQSLHRQMQAWYFKQETKAGDEICLVGMIM